MGVHGEQQYEHMLPKSRQLWERAVKVTRGIHHDARHIAPFPIFSVGAEGTRTWDVDGNEYLDYTMGHGSLLLGHAHPLLIQAVSQQVAKGTHYGYENELGLEWAELITRLVPAAEKVEFVMSGTEANMLILQIARAFTGRKKIVKFAEHFFGWSDHLLVGVSQPYDMPTPGRLPSSVKGAVSDATVVLPCNDIAAMEEALAREDVAALFLEGGGAHAGDIAMPARLVEKARELTWKYGTLLVIDEVITGFRWSPGGYQATVGVTPDLTPLGKMVSGGLPGGAVCGRADLIDMLNIIPGEAEWNRHKRVPHPGTWNANPLSAAAGISMLQAVSSGEPQKKAIALSERLSLGMNQEIKKRKVQGCVFNAASRISIHLGECMGCDRSSCLDSKKKMPGELVNSLHQQMHINGIAFLRGTLGFVSAVHTEADIDQTIEAFGAALDGMIKDGSLT